MKDHYYFLEKTVLQRTREIGWIEKHAWKWTDERRGRPVKPILSWMRLIFAR
jgi:hypothetical protein